MWKDEEEKFHQALKTGEAKEQDIHRLQMPTIPFVSTWLAADLDESRGAETCSSLAQVQARQIMTRADFIEGEPGFFEFLTRGN